VRAKVIRLLKRVIRYLCEQDSDYYDTGFSWEDSKDQR
jgi:hypothetical protein